MPDTLPHNPLPEDLPRGFQLGQYVLLAKLGQGGMGSVYKALHARLKRVVALKVLRSSRVPDPRSLARFRREMEIVGKLDHPHVIRATDAGEAAGHAYLVMDLIDGPNLYQLAQHTRPIPLADACELVRQSAAGLDCIHSHGLVHRDIKPSNLMLGTDGKVRILDLGLSRLHEDDPVDERLTDSGQIMGTADYMAPEQGTNSHDVDIRADIYSLGCTLYFLLAGQPPFGGAEYDSRFKKILAHSQKPVPPLRDRRPECPDGLSAILDRMLAKTPGERFATPVDVEAALRPFTEGNSLGVLLVSARSAMPVEQPTDALAHALTTPAGGFSLGPQDPGLVQLASSLAPTRDDRKKNWRVAPVVGMLLAAALAVLLFVMGPSWFPSSPPSRPSPSEDQPPDSQGEKPPREFPLREWSSLLDRKPAALLWPGSAVNSTWAFDEKEQRLTVNCHDVALFGFGAPPGPAYVFQVGIEQSTWHGGAGCCFGFRETEEAGQKIVHFQRIELQPYLAQDEAKAFKLCRTVAQFKKTGKQHLHQRTMTLLSQAVPKPLPGEHVLELTVEKRGLTRVRWGSRELQDLVSENVNTQFGPETYQGLLGTFSNSSASVFHNARLMRLEESKP